MKTFLTTLLGLAVLSAPAQASKYLYLSTSAEKLVYSNMCSAYRGGTSTRDLLDFGIRLVTQYAEPEMSRANLSLEVANLIHYERKREIIDETGRIGKMVIYDDNCTPSRL